MRLKSRASDGRAYASVRDDGCAQEYVPTFWFRSEHIRFARGPMLTSVYVARQVVDLTCKLCR